MHEQDNRYGFQNVIRDVFRRQRRKVGGFDNLGALALYLLTSLGVIFAIIFI